MALPPAPEYSRRAACGPGPAAQPATSSEPLPMTKTTSTLLAACLALATLHLPAAAQDIQERTIKFGHLNNTDHPTSTGVKKFAEIVAAKSGGKIKVQEFASSQLGNELQQQGGDAGRRAGNARGVDDVAGRHRQGIRPLRLPVPVQQCAASRRHGGRPAGQDARRQAGGEGRGRAGLLRPGFPQRHQQQAARSRRARIWMA